MKQVEIQGSHIFDIASFYEEINRVFMQQEDWKLGQTLDGFNDLLYGGFGLLNPSEEISLIWKDIQSSKAALGLETTRKYYLGKLAPKSPFNKNHFKAALQQLEAGQGKTYFDLIIEIIEAHPNIHLTTA
ncbi:hypothetical protein GCM10027566_12270 [Arachidicoccus ginsenosidivorans]|nr:hypothetical protein [Arachidicoccus ginsenosidivorans]